MSRFSLPIAILLLAPLLVGAQGDGYVGAAVYGHEDTDVTDSVLNRGSSPFGYWVTAQVPMPTEPLAYFVEYGNTDVLEQFSVGLQAHRQLWFSLQGTLGASVEFEDMTDKKGYGLRAGLRWWPFGPRLELNPEVRYEELFYASTSARLTAALQIRGPLYLDAAAQLGDEERFLLGVRYELR
jgi:hypothetical protein